MSEPSKIYGFRWKQLPTGERAPDCAWLIRFVMHYFWLLLFHATPIDWQLERSGKLRNKVGITILQSFAWWAYQHQKYRGYSKLWWEKCSQ